MGIGVRRQVRGAAGSVGYFSRCAAGPCFSRSCLEEGERDERQQRLVALAIRPHGLSYGMGYAWTTGRRDGLGASGQDPQGRTEKFKIRTLQKQNGSMRAHGDVELLPGSSPAKKTRGDRQVPKAAVL